MSNNGDNMSSVDLMYEDKSIIRCFLASAEAGPLSSISSLSTESSSSDDLAKIILEEIEEESPEIESESENEVEEAVNEDSSSNSKFNEIARIVSISSTLLIFRFRSAFGF